MEHHGWEFTLDVLVRLCAIVAWPTVIYLLARSFRRQVGGVIDALRNVIERISKVSRTGRGTVTLELQRITGLPPLRPYEREDMKPSPGVPVEEVRSPGWDIEETSVESIPAETRK